MTPAALAGRVAPDSILTAHLVSPHCAAVAELEVLVSTSVSDCPERAARIAEGTSVDPNDRPECNLARLLLPPVAQVPHTCRQESRTPLWKVAPEKCRLVFVHVEQGTP